MITRVDYDNETNRLVGFVLPCDDEGLPLCDSFLAVSFEAIEESFKTADTAKYAFVYMAQALGKAVPGFCLACLGTNNEFSADLMLKRWKYVLQSVKGGEQKLLHLELMEIRVK